MYTENYELVIIVLSERNGCKIPWLEVAMGIWPKQREIQKS